MRCLEGGTSVTVGVGDLLTAIQQLGLWGGLLFAILSIAAVVGFAVLNHRITTSETRLSSVLGREDYRFTKLLERQVDVVCDVYRKLDALHQSVVSLVHPAEFPGEPTKDEKATQAQAAFDAFTAAYNPNRIWFDAVTCDAVDAFAKELVGATLKYRTSRSADNAEVWIAAWEQADKKVMPARRSIEDLFRRILLGAAPSD
jgi:hypothetical protein